MLLKRSGTVDFDPSNSEHRSAVRAFMRRRAWADSPIKFTHNPPVGDLASQIQSKLLNWYVAQEEADIR